MMDALEAFTNAAVGLLVSWAAILKAREAYLRPGFQRQIGRNPADLIEHGAAA